MQSLRMTTKYTGSGGGKVIVENGITTSSDAPQFCPVGQKPNMDFLRRCGWKKEKKPVVYYAHGGTNPDRFKL